MFNYLIVSLLSHSLILWKTEAYIIAAQTRYLRMVHSFTVIGKNNLIEHNKPKVTPQLLLSNVLEQENMQFSVVAWVQK